MREQHALTADEEDEYSDSDDQTDSDIDNESSDSEEESQERKEELILALTSNHHYLKQMKLIMITLKRCFN